MIIVIRKTFIYHLRLGCNRKTNKHITYILQYIIRKEMYNKYENTILFT